MRVRQGEMGPGDPWGWGAPGSMSGPSGAGTGSRGRWGEMREGRSCWTSSSESEMAPKL